MKKLLRRLLVATFVAVCAAGTLETLLLLFGFDYPPPPSPLPSVFAGGRIEGRLVHARDRELLWSPIARAELPWFGERLSSDGFRSAPGARERASGTLRIAALGDAVAFGSGVHANECWIQVAAEKLGARGRACEALNAGVIGFTSRQGRARYVRDVRPWKPDVVVAAFGACEEHVAASLVGDDELIARETLGVSGWSTFTERVRRELKLAHLAARLLGRPGGSRDAAGVPGDLLRVGEDFDPAGEPGWSGVRRVSPEEFRADLRALAREVHADGARLVLVAPHRQPRLTRAAPVLEDYTRITLEVGRELDLSVIDVKPLLAELVKEGATYQDLFLGPIEPTALVHARIGAALADELEARLSR